MAPIISVNSPRYLDVMVESYNATELTSVLTVFPPQYLDQIHRVSSMKFYYSTIKFINQHSYEMNSIPANTRHYLDVESTCFERYGRWMDVKTTLCAYGNVKRDKESV